MLPPFRDFSHEYSQKSFWRNLSSKVFFCKCCLERNISFYTIHRIDKLTDVINYTSGVTEAL